jgi:hypothetical protein
MIGDLPTLLNQKAEFVAQRIRDAGHDPTFQEADAELEELGYFSPSTLGIDVTIAGDGLTETIHIYSQSHHGRRGYDGPMPGGLSFGMNRQEVRRLLGNPIAHGGPVSSPLDPSKIYWDRWQRTGYHLHCEYPGDMSRIQMVTITRTKNAEPGAAPNGGPATSPGNSGVTEGELIRSAAGASNKHEY